MLSQRTGDESVFTLLLDIEPFLSHLVGLNEVTPSWRRLAQFAEIIGIQLPQLHSKRHILFLIHLADRMRVLLEPASPELTNNFTSPTSLHVLLELSAEQVVQNG